ncbi:hypothetical protein BCV72DRAFT_139170 [Rhizopus microsporus var. microsporus]|uniref:Uncharacterized protein n=1 Tax=Rhizopus microsporus var. microsporus TaxID=86635 RepID=A0A1X0R0K4_RHIZD|nr:hypothetical protein BCV72DRAFT_139170 [Rhizopus microsporus var. microsporus]
MISIPKKSEVVTLGYYEMRFSDIRANLELAFADLVRMSTLSRGFVLKKENKKAVTMQAVRYRTVFYFAKETFPNVTTMTKTLSFGVPKTTVLLEIEANLPFV